MAKNQAILEVAWLGQVEYRAAWDLQNRLAAQITAGERPPALLLLEHPHVYTIGRRGGQANLIWNDRERTKHGVDLVEVDRGGDITYHGPGQLVGYPLMRLAVPGWQGERLPQADFVGYLRRLEAVLIDTLASFNIPAIRKEGYTGVWVPASRLDEQPGVEPQDGKIVSIGVKVDARGVTRHGFALNVQPQMDYWQGIIPCGLEGVRMLSMADLLSQVPDVSQVADRVALAFGRTFDFKLVWNNSLEGMKS